jgi:hypothetical protein
MKRVGYGQVELNHVAAQKTGQILAQYKLKDAKQAENGQFVSITPDGLDRPTSADNLYVVYNEVKLYDGLRETTKDFVQKADADGDVIPRVYKVQVGDIFTTNAFEAASTGADGETSFSANTKAVINPEGFLSLSASAGTGTFEVLEKTTMPDGQDAYKLVRTA